MRKKSYETIAVSNTDNLVNNITNIYIYIKKVNTNINIREFYDTLRFKGAVCKRFHVLITFLLPVCKQLVLKLNTKKIIITSQSS